MSKWQLASWRFGRKKKTANSVENQMVYAVHSSEKLRERWKYVTSSSLSVLIGMPELSLEHLWNHVHHMPRVSGWKLKWHGGANERSFPVLLRLLSLKMRKWNNIFQAKHRLLDAYFRREKYKKWITNFWYCPLPSTDMIIKLADGWQIFAPPGIPNSIHML